MSKFEQPEIKKKVTLYVLGYIYTTRSEIFDFLLRK